MTKKNNSQVRKITVLHRIRRYLPSLDLFKNSDENIIQWKCAKYYVGTSSSNKYKLQNGSRSLSTSVSNPECCCCGMKIRVGQNYDEEAQSSGDVELHRSFCHRTTGSWKRLSSWTERNEYDTQLADPTCSSVPEVLRAHTFAASGTTRSNHFCKSIRKLRKSL